MPLDQEHKDAFQEHAREFLKTCPICANTTWELLSEMVAPFVWRPEPKVIFPGMIAGATTGPEIVPFVFAVCTRCFFSAPFPWLIIEAKLAQKRQEKSHG